MSYPKEQVDTMQAVYDMREAQREYFKQPDKYRLQVAKLKEQRVDMLLGPYLSAGVVKPKEKVNDIQQSIFQ